MRIDQNLAAGRALVLELVIAEVAGYPLLAGRPGHRSTLVGIHGAGIKTVQDHAAVPVDNFKRRQQLPALQALSIGLEGVLALTSHRSALGSHATLGLHGATPTAGVPRIRATQGRVHLDFTAASDCGRSSF
jgi:hypothetical protein